MTFRLTPSRDLPVLIVAALVVGSFLWRVPELSIGLPYLWHWDEPQNMNNALRMYRDGNLDPHFFFYPSVTIYLQLLWLHVSHPVAVLSGIIGDASELVVGNQQEYPWFVSHPWFYGSGRLFVSLLGAASVALAYFVGKKLSDRNAGLVAAALLAFNSFYIEHSVTITVDISTAFFTLIWCWLLLEYLEKKTRSRLIAVAIAAGLVVSCKYNAVPVMIPTLLAAWLSTDGDGQDKTRAGLVATWCAALGFFIGTPYFLIEIDAAVAGLLREFYHYAVYGHGDDTIRSFWGKLWHDTTFLFREFSGKPIVPLFLPLLAWRIYRAGWRDPYVLTMLFPACYVLFMALMVVTFTRNFVLMVPLLSVATGFWISHIGEALTLRFKSRLGGRSLTPWLTAAVVAIAVLPPLAELPGRFSAPPSVDSRTAAMQWLARTAVPALRPDERIAVASELRVHPHDRAETRAHTIDVEALSLRREMLRELGIRYLVLPEIQSKDTRRTTRRDRIAGWGRTIKELGNQPLLIDRQLPTAIVDPALTILEFE